MKTINVYYSDFAIFKGLKEVMEIVISRGIKLFTVTRICNNFIEVSFEFDHNNPYKQAEHYVKTNCVLLYTPQNK